MKESKKIILSSTITVCECCDLLLEMLPVSVGEIGYCPRCGAVLRAPKEKTVSRTLIVSMAGLLFFVPGVFFPLLTLEALGTQQKASIADGCVALYNSGYFFVAIILLLTSILLPLAKHGLLFFLSICLQLRVFPVQLEYCLRLYHHLKDWGMDEVYLIGVMVALIKVYAMADVIYEIGFFAFLGLVISTVSLSFCFDSQYFWNTIENTRNNTIP